MSSIVFYQNEACHHKSPFIRSLASRNGLQVSLVTDMDVEPYRQAMGLSRADYGLTKVTIPKNVHDVEMIVDGMDSTTIHVVEGMRGGFSSRHAMQYCLKNKRRTALFTEPGDPRGAKGVARKLLYAYEARKWGRTIQCILATGKLGVDWFVEHGYPCEHVFPFCYAVEGPDAIITEPVLQRPVHIVYCGQLIPRKNIPLLLRALCENSHEQWRLSVIGNGPLKGPLAEMAHRLGIADRIAWHNILSNAMATKLISQADLLVLPSDFDGWGAVVNEALVEGTPAICSDMCGASDLLLEEWRGKVFRAGSVDELASALHTRITAGPVSSVLRLQIASWARRTISGDAVAAYFIKIMDHIYHGARKPTAPWRDHLPRIDSFEKPMIGATREGI